MAKLMPDSNKCMVHHRLTTFSVLEKKDNLNFHEYSCYQTQMTVTMSTTMYIGSHFLMNCATCDSQSPDDTTL